MEVKRKRERTRKSRQVFFFKVSQEVRAPTPEVCWADKNGLARGGRTKWDWGRLIEIQIIIMSRGPWRLTAILQIYSSVCSFQINIEPAEPLGCRPATKVG